MSADSIATPTSPRRLGARLIAIASIAALVAWAGGPAIRGFWVRDDFGLIAYFRLLGTPWALFAHDHFPVPGSIFRPLGFASLWLTQTLVGTGYRANFAVELALHAVVAVALYRVARIALPRVAAVVVASLFAIHPTAIGAAVWLSDRFDLLALLFTLIALRAAFDYRERTSRGVLATVLIAALAAVASKEVGLTAFAAVGFVWLDLAARGEEAPRFRRALVGLVFVAAFYFLWRWLVIGTLGSGLTGEPSVSAAIVRGTQKWLDYALEFFTFGPRLADADRVVLGVASVVSLFAIIYAAADRDARPRPRDFALGLSAIALVFVPALLQAPVTAANGAPLAVDVSAVEIAMRSRLYYTSLAGVALFVAVCVACALRGRRVVAARIGVVALAVGALTFAVVAHRVARDYARRTAETMPLALAAVDAIASRPLPSTNCHVYFLDYAPPSEWSVFVAMDSVVKALAPDLSRVQSCLIHSPHPTYLYLLPRERAAASTAPFVPTMRDGKRVPWLTVGDLEIAFLDPPPALDANAIREGVFFAYDGKRFVDVGDDVIAGLRAVDPK